MKVVIISNGTLGKIKLSDLTKGADMIICADGGAKYLESMEVFPTVIIGDMDSIDKNTLTTYKKMGIDLIKFPVKKDKTDTELAVEYAIEKGAREITLLGATGTRLDHTLANVFLLYKILKQGIKGRILDSNNEISIIEKNTEVSKDNFTNVSLIPLNLNNNIATLKGFEYNTNKQNFKFSSSYGVSNSLAENKGTIEIDNGIFILIKSRD